MEKWRRMEKISWTDKITNEEVLERVGIDRQLINMIRNKKKSWIGYVLTLRDDSLLKEVLERRMEGRRVKGRPRLRMFYNDLTMHLYVDMKRKTDDKEKLRRYMP